MRIRVVAFEIDARDGEQLRREEDDRAWAEATKPIDDDPTWATALQVLGAFLVKMGTDEAARARAKASETPAEAEDAPSDPAGHAGARGETTPE